LRLGTYLAHQAVAIPDLDRLVIDRLLQPLGRESPHAIVVPKFHDQQGRRAVSAVVDVECVTLHVRPSLPYGCASFDLVIGPDSEWPQVYAYSLLLKVNKLPK